MLFEDIYHLAVDMGSKADPRGIEAVEKDLAEAAKAWQKLDEGEKEFFDVERLKNPYADTRILTGEKDSEIKSILVGIDMEVGEVLLADQLVARGTDIDLILSHHPEGRALSRLADVMHLQKGHMSAYGVPANVAYPIMEERINEIDRAFAPSNHYRAVDAAALLGFNFACVHTPADNLATEYMRNFLQVREDESLADVVKAMKTIPEYNAAAKRGAGPKILNGAPNCPLGQAYVDFTGGTSGPDENIKALVRAGVNTVVCMHIPEKNLKTAKEYHLNVILAGHMSSDSLGMNLLLDEIECRGVEIIPTSGLIRIKRK